MPKTNLTRSLCAAAMAAMALAAGEAHAQAFVRGECQKLIGPGGHEAGSVSERWYKRFWTGECTGLSGCFRGSPNWNEVVGKLSARAQPAERAAVMSRACKLGPLIGLEWSRPKKVRRIDTGDLRGFNKTLDGAGGVLAGIEKVEAQVRAKLPG